MNNPGQSGAEGVPKHPSRLPPDLACQLRRYAWAQRAPQILDPADEPAEETMSIEPSGGDGLVEAGVAAVAALLKRSGSARAA